MRTVIYTHLAAVAVSVAISLIARWRFVSIPVSEALQPLLMPLSFSVALAWFACPLLMLLMIGVLIWNRPPLRQAVPALLAERLLTIAQLLALLPACATWTP